MENIFNLTFTAVEEDKVLTALRAISLAAAVPRKHRINPVAGDSGGLGDVSVATVAAALTMAQGHVTLRITLNSDEAVIIIIVNDALVVIIIVLGLCCL